MVLVEIKDTIHSLVKVVGELFNSEPFSSLCTLYLVIPNFYYLRQGVLGSLYNYAVSCDDLEFGIVFNDFLLDLSDMGREGIHL